MVAAPALLDLLQFQKVLHLVVMDFSFYLLDHLQQLNQ